MLDVIGLHVEAGDKEVIKGISFRVKEGETCVLFGPNGSGKSTLLSAIMGYSSCRITKGSIFFKSVDITHMAINERAKLGVGMMMQRPPNVPGVKLGDLIRTSIKGGGDVTERASDLRMNEFLVRDVNVGFSGGEIKRSELLQLTAQSPDFILLDEPESGVDLENIKLIGEKVRDLLYSGQTRGCKYNRRHVSSLVITHTGQILDYIGADKGYILQDGLIRCSGRPSDILNDIRENGYKECTSCKMIQIE